MNIPKAVSLKIMETAHAVGYIYIRVYIYIQCNFSKPSTLGTTDNVQFREVPGLEGSLCTANIESRT